MFMEEDFLQCCCESASHQFNINRIAPPDAEMFFERLVTRRGDVASTKTNRDPEADAQAREEEKEQQGGRMLLLSMECSLCVRACAFDSMAHCSRTALNCEFACAAFLGPLPQMVPLSSPSICLPPGAAL
jgi:hypothetical protein